MRVAVIGDVGVVDGLVHLGDEGMFDALVEALRARSVISMVGISNAPAETSARYGIEAVCRIGFSVARAEMESWFDRVLRCSNGERVLPADDPVWTVIDAVSDRPPCRSHWPPRRVRSPFRITRSAPHRG